MNFYSKLGLALLICAAGCGQTALGKLQELADKSFKDQAYEGKVTVRPGTGTVAWVSFTDKTTGHPYVYKAGIWTDGNWMIEAGGDTTPDAPAHKLHD